MVDGLVVSALTHLQSQERLEFGALPLHIGLRAFEALLHIDTLATNKM